MKKSVEVFNNPKIFTKTIEEIIAQNRIIVNNWNKNIGRKKAKKLSLNKMNDCSILSRTPSFTVNIISELKNIALLHSIYII